MANNKKICNMSELSLGEYCIVYLNGVYYRAKFIEYNESNSKVNYFV